MQRLDYVPEYLSDDVKRRLEALTEESTPEPAPLEVNEYLIRHWCETFEDGNPLYLDADYARSRGLRGVVAPLGSLMMTFAMPFRWPWPPPEGEPVQNIHFEIKDLLELPVGIVTKTEIESGVPLQVGDRLMMSQRLVSISPWKKTRLGEGHFWTMEKIYRNQSGELVMRYRNTAFGYGRDAAPGARSGDAPRDRAASGGWSPAIEEAIQGERSGYARPAYRDRLWEEVREGEELPQLVMPITVTRCVYLASATRDFSPHHSNRDYAQQRSGTKDVFVNTPFNIGMVGRFLTDWGGPGATVRRMEIAMRGNVCAGDDMVLTGTVVRKYREGGEHLVDIDVTISTQDGVSVPCKGTVALATG